MITSNVDSLGLAWLRWSIDTAGRLDGQPIGFASDNSLADVILPLACMVSGKIEVPFDHRLGESVGELWKQVDGRWLTPADRQRLIDQARQANSDSQRRFGLA